MIQAPYFYHTVILPTSVIFFDDYAVTTVADVVPIQGLPWFTCGTTPYTVYIVLFCSRCY
ncbi:hypothetical protein BJ165DRAFT_1013789 [Panaeolus papilionaceus]|nr:hypothetical protein BJ165DRAFT_1013789 [Panaeolus papilionaceus]